MLCHSSSPSSCLTYSSFSTTISPFGTVCYFYLLLLSPFFLPFFLSLALPLFFFFPFFFSLSFPSFFVASFIHSGLKNTIKFLHVTKREKGRKRRKKSRNQLSQSTRSRQWLHSNIQIVLCVGRYQEEGMNGKREKENDVEGRVKKKRKREREGGNEGEKGWKKKSEKSRKNSRIIFPVTQTRGNCLNCVFCSCFIFGSFFILFFLSLFHSVSKS